MTRMSINADFSSEEYSLFEQKCNFNKYNGELEVYKMLKDGASIVKIATTLGLSEATVSRRIRSIKIKILRVIR